jgi:hypothetical protein
MYGSRDFDEDTGAYVKSACVVILFVPLFVISSYVVNDAQYAGWHILGRVPLSSFARAWNVVVALLLCMAIFACVLSRF